MVTNLDAAALVRRARERAGLSQRELASRAGTAQSVVSRIEGGLTDPSTGTLLGLLEAAGFDLAAELRPVAVAGTHMLDDVDRILALTPEERLIEIRNISRFEQAARSG
jgi:transcriptional regulator with XRE-family HTH domain